MRQINTTKGTWKISGINLIPSDSIYVELKKCIENGELEESHLQKITGHLLPIIVNHKKQTIEFSTF